MNVTQLTSPAIAIPSQVGGCFLLPVVPVANDNAYSDATEPDQFIPPRSTKRQTYLSAKDERKLIAAIQYGVRNGTDTSVAERKLEVLRPLIIMTKKIE